MEDKFNTVYARLLCPFCRQKVESGIGFKVGVLDNTAYKLGDKLKWHGSPCRPEQRPGDGNLATIGYFNCDNINCGSWQDCFPTVQEAIVIVENDVIVDVFVNKEARGGNDFAILDRNMTKIKKPDSQT